MKSNVSSPWFSDVSTGPVQDIDRSAPPVPVNMRMAGSLWARHRPRRREGAAAPQGTAQILSLPGGERVARRRGAEPHQTLGRFPEVAVAALADLGLSDAEMARYFRVERSMITGLRRHGEGANAETGSEGAIEA